MSLRLCVLGSGSSGNCVYVGSDRTHVLIDAGLSGKETESRLRHVGIGLSDVSAVCVTHEHDDHTASLGILSRRTGLGLYANAGTIDGIGRRSKRDDLRWNVFTTGAAFQIGDLTVEPFSVPHDSYDPVGFVVHGGGGRVGVVTDMGMATELIRQRLRTCQAVVVEANHDDVMLKNAFRPWSLKQRIAGRQGHLSNEQAAQLLSEIARPALQLAFLAHLSSDCNRPDMALHAIRNRLAASGCTQVRTELTFPDRPGDLVECVEGAVRTVIPAASWNPKGQEG